MLFLLPRTLFPAWHTEHTSQKHSLWNDMIIVLMTLRITSHRVPLLRGQGENITQFFVPGKATHVLDPG